VLRAEKIKVVDQLKEIFSNHTAVVLAHYHGLNMKQISELRKDMRDQGIKFMVSKNSLMKIAIKDTDFSALEEHLNGPTVIAASTDPVAVTKTLTKFIKENKQLKLIGAIVDNKTLGVEAIRVLSKMPSLDELRAKIVSLLSTPATSVASVLVAPAIKVARVLSVYSKQQ
jgi:large subunit ribosomal protein L10